VIQWFADHIVPKHRIYFVVATALLGVAGSFVAADPGKLSYWLAFVGLIMAMYAADVCAEVESEVRLVAQPKRVDKRKTRMGSLMSKRPHRLLAVSFISALLVLVGFIGGAIGGDQWITERTAPLRSAISGTPVSVFHDSDSTESDLVEGGARQ
jgi:hypothetical protein